MNKIFDAMQKSGLGTGGKVGEGAGHKTAEPDSPIASLPEGRAVEPAAGLQTEYRKADLLVETDELVKPQPMKSPKRRSRKQGGGGFIFLMLVLLIAGGAAFWALKSQDPEMAASLTENAQEKIIHVSDLIYDWLITTIDELKVMFEGKATP